jgi:pimeloyl-ACP methyl ester carboxylesterase
MERIDMARIQLDVEITGNGPPLLYLHSEHYLHLQKPFIERLAAKWTVYVPHHPGFDGRNPPSDFRRVEDLTYLYLDLIERDGLDGVTLLGSSFGGWIAMEMAVRNCTRLMGLCLIAPLGARLGTRSDRDFADLFALSETDAAAALFAKKAPDFSDFSADEMTATARDRQFLAYYGWKPYLHNPSLARWLHRIVVPTQLIWGDKDGFVPLGYGRQLTELIPGARLDVISGSGHYPQLERLDKTLATLLAGPCGNRITTQGI